MRRLLGSKGGALALVALLGGAGMLAWSMPWFEVDLVPGASLDSTLTVGGDAAAPALVPLSLAVLALVGALAIAARVVRPVLAVVLAGLGAGMVATAAIAASDPRAAVAASVTESTGLDGEWAADGSIAGLSSTAWPVVAMVVGALVVTVAIVILLRARRWPDSSDRWQAPSGRDAGASGEPGTGLPAPSPRPSAASDWDALSAGDDPTGPSGAR